MHVTSYVSSNGYIKGIVVDNGLFLVNIGNYHPLEFTSVRYHQEFIEQYFLTGIMYCVWRIRMFGSYGFGKDLWVLVNITDRKILCSSEKPSDIADYLQAHEC